MLGQGAASASPQSRRGASCSGEHLWYVLIRGIPAEADYLAY